MIRRNSINEAWTELLHQLFYTPEHRPEPRGLKTNEILGVTLRVDDLRNNLLYHPVRNLNYKFAVAEWLWISYGRDDVATLARYNSQITRFSDDGVTFAGAYGPRLKTQWQYLVDAISKDYFSRQAVATIWTPSPKGSKDVPCTVALQLIARDNKLNGIVTMRSSDIWLGLPYDFFTFSQLVNSLAGVLGLKTGFLQFNLGSSHLYESDFSKAKELLENNNGDLCESFRSPYLPYFPPVMSFTTPITLEDVLVEPKKFIDNRLPYPWGMYAAVLNSDNWTQAREILSAQND